MRTLHAFLDVQGVGDATESGAMAEPTQPAPDERQRLHMNVWDHSVYEEAQVSISFKLHCLLPHLYFRRSPTVFFLSWSWRGARYLASMPSDVSSVVEQPCCTSA